MSEQIGAVFIFAGLAALAVALLWAVARGLAVLVRGRPARSLLAPLALAGIGLVLGAAPLVAQRAWLAIVSPGSGAWRACGSPARG
jgi:hypothetical protein